MEFNDLLKRGKLKYLRLAAISSKLKCYLEDESYRCLGLFCTLFVPKNYVNNLFYKRRLLKKKSTLIYLIKKNNSMLFLYKHSVIGI